MKPLRLTSLAALAALLLGWVLPSAAAIAPGTTGNGELFLNVYDSTARVSFAYDTGLRMDDFFIQGQLDGGSQTFWAIGPADNALFARFLSLVSSSNLLWSIVAIDSDGNNNEGQHRLYTTVRQGDESKIASVTNTRLSTGIGTSIAGNFFNTINSTALANLGQSTHATSAVASQSDYSVNGSSYALATDAGSAYYGKAGALTPTYNGNTAFSAGNAVGASSWFYYLTRSGSSAGGLVKVDEFDNGDGINAGSGHDGYWGFTRVSDSTSPYDGSYLLSYTLEPRVYTFVAPTRLQREFAASIGRTEFTGGARIERLDGAAAAAVLENSAGWVTPLGTVGAVGNAAELGLDRLATPAISPVPEPASAWLLALGGAALWRARRGGKPQVGAA